MTVEINLPGRQTLETNDASSQRRFPATGLADQSKSFAASHLKADVVYCTEVLLLSKKPTASDRKVLNEMFNPKKTLAHEEVPRFSVLSSSSQHAESCLSSVGTARNGGASTLQRSITCGQRG